MRLTSIAVRNYRVHRDLRVEVDSACTLIGGANESGKSTLVEAAHRALFLRAKTGGETQREMVSSIHSGHPEVEVTFESRGKLWQVVKRFSGASGTVTLTETGGASFSGDEAEVRLAALLGVEAIGGGRGAGDRAAQQWAHIWVRQGTAGDDPAAHANAQRDALMERLQSGDGAAAMQSALDARVAGAVAELCETMFTKAGEPRAGSDLFTALKEESEATAALETAQQNLAKLEHAAQDFQQAEKTIKDAAAALESLRPQQQAAEAKLTCAAELRSEETTQAAAVSLAAEKHAALAKADGDILALRQEITRRREALAPGESEVKRAAEEEETCRHRESAAGRAAAECIGLVRAARLRHELAAAHVQRLERLSERDLLTKKREEILTVREERTRLKEKLTQLPPVSSADLKALQSLDRECSNAEAALQAMAAGVEVLTAGMVVSVGGQPIAAGASQIITDDAEITVGDNVCLRIRPGGGTSLSETRQRLGEANAKRQRALDELGVPSLSTAAEAAVVRQQVESELKSLAARLEGMGDSRIDAEAATAEQSCAAAEAEVARRSAEATDLPAPSTLTDARALLQEWSRKLSEEENREVTARATREATALASRAATASHAAASAKVAEERSKTAAAEATLEYLLKEHGADEARGQTLADLSAAKSGAEKILTITRQALAELQPEFLESDLKRLRRATDQHAASRMDAEMKRAVAQSALVRDGTNDPAADAAMARERLRAAAARREVAERRARAIQLLHRLFLSAKQELADRFTRPLAEKISGYLECLFGPGTRAVVQLEEDRFTSLQLVRPSHAAGAFDFTSLSGGAKEQLAAAFRLAMAEVLAAGHDGCLPVVFDDAFAYADPDRVQILQRMLDLAASRGLQIIVLTCTPADYAALGAKQHLLPAPGALLP